MSEGPGEKRELTVGTDGNAKVVKKIKKLTESFNKSTLYYREKYRKYRTGKVRRKNHDSFNSPSGSQEELDGSSSKSHKKESAEEKLQEMWKDAKIGLIYFNAIVSNRMLEQFSGSATEILEVVIKILDQLSRSQFSPEISSVLMSCRSHVIQRLAELVHWADIIMLESDDEAKNSQITRGPAIINSVQKGVEELVTEALNKLKTQKSEFSSLTLPGRAISLPDVFGTMRTAHHHRSPSLAFVPRFDFTPRNGEADYTGESKPIFSAGHGEKVPPIPPKKKISTHKPVGIVAPFNHNLESPSGSLSVFGVKGLTRSEECLLQHNNPFHMIVEGGDRSSYCSSFSTDTTDSAELLNGEAYDASTLRYYNRHRSPEFNLHHSIRHSDDVGRQLNKAYLHPDIERPMSYPTCHIPIRLYLSDGGKRLSLSSNNLADFSSDLYPPARRVNSTGCLLDSPGLDLGKEEDTDEYDSSRYSVCSSAYGDPEIPPALPAKLNKNPFADRSSRDFTFFEKAESDDEEPPPLPTKKSKFEQYMQVFSQTEQQPPPPINDDDVYLEIVQRYNAPFGHSSSLKSAAPSGDEVPKVPPRIRSGAEEFEEKAGNFAENSSSPRTRDSGISSSSSGNLMSSLHTSLSSISSLADHSGLGHATQLADTPPALPPKTRKPSMRNRSKTMPPNLSLGHQSFDAPLTGSSGTSLTGSSGIGSMTSQELIFQFPQTSNSNIFHNHSPPYLPPHLHHPAHHIHPKRASGGYLRSVLDPHRTDNGTMSCPNSSAYRKYSHNGDAPRLVRQVAHVHPNPESSVITHHGDNQERRAPPVPRKSHSLAESDLRKNRENLPSLTPHHHPETSTPSQEQPEETTTTTTSTSNNDSDQQSSPQNSSKRHGTSSMPADLPLPDPGNLLDRVESTDYLTFNTRSDQSTPEVCAGCADALIVYAAEANKKNYIYFEAFLTTYRTFISTKELLEKLLHRQKLFGSESTKAADRSSSRTSRNAFFLLVRVVDELSFLDITKPVLDMLMNLVYELLCDGELMLAKLLRTKVLAKYEKKLTNPVESIQQPLSSLHVTSKVLSIHDFSSEKLAEQMTLLDFELFQKVEIPELLQWSKNQSEELCSNLTRFTEHFNNMSYWTRTIILTQQKPQERERLLNKFIRTMRHLRKLNNFNSYLAVLSALDSAPVRRLEWQKQTTEGLQEYCSLIDSSSSFRTYRAALAEATRPCIPYLGLILQDLTFIHLGNPDELAPGVVNFRKRWQQFNILDTVRRFKQSQYELNRDEDVVAFFDKFKDHLSEEALWDLSLVIKPRHRRPRRPPPEEDQQTVTSADQSQDYSSNVSTSTKESDQTSLRPEEG